MLDKGLPPNEVSFNTLVNGWVKKGCMDKAQKVVDEQMIARGLSPNEVCRAFCAYADMPRCSGAFYHPHRTCGVLLR